MCCPHGRAEEDPDRAVCDTVHAAVQPTKDDAEHVPSETGLNDVQRCARDGFGEVEAINNGVHV